MVQVSRSPPSPQATTPCPCSDGASAAAPDPSSHCPAHVAWPAAGGPLTAAAPLGTLPKGARVEHMDAAANVTDSNVNQTNRLLPLLAGCALRRTGGGDRSGHHQQRHCGAATGCRAHPHARSTAVRCVIRLQEAHSSCLAVPRADCGRRGPAGNIHSGRTHNSLCGLVRCRGRRLGRQGRCKVSDYARIKRDL